MIRPVFCVLLACGSSSSTDPSKDPAKQTTPGGIPSYVKCVKNMTTGTCRCSESETPRSGETSVANCDTPPSDGRVCAFLVKGKVAACGINPVACADIAHNYGSCECSVQGGTTTPQKSSCAGSTCCQFADMCQCTMFTGGSISNTQFDRDCTYLKPGTKVSSCAASNAHRPPCDAPETNIDTCANLEWAPQGALSSGSHPGGNSTGCAGNSDCGSCYRCETSTGTCVAKASCR